jgi:DNA-binding beta-propeller fold protein YncE
MNTMNAVRRLVVASVCTSLTILAPAIAPAFAATKGVVSAFGTEGTDAGQFSAALGVAVNQASGEVYVVDSADDRVERFTAAGGYLSEFGGEGAGAGQLSAPQGIAVEQTTGDVYLTDRENHRVDEFTGAGTFVRAFGWGVRNGEAKLQVCTAVSTCQAGMSGAGAGEFGETVGYLAIDNAVPGDVYVADSANHRVDEFTGAGAFVHAFGWGVKDGADAPEVCTSTCEVGVPGVGAGQFSEEAPARIAVDPAGFIYALDPGDGRIQKFELSGTVVAESFASRQLAGSAPTDIAIDPANGDVYVAVESPEREVLEFDSNGDLLQLDAEGAGLPRITGLAVASSEVSGNVYLSSGNRVLILNAQPVPPTATISPATVTSSSEATLSGEVDPEEAGPQGLETTYRFEYSANRVDWKPAGEGRLPAGTSAVPVSTGVGGLLANTPYHVRLRAEKEFKAGEATSGEAEFTTHSAPPSVSGESFSEVGAVYATLSAQINPGGLPSTYFFEYVDAADYDPAAPNPYSAGARTASVEVPTGATAVAVSESLHGLREGTEYHFRVVATNGDGVNRGSDLIFTTFTAGAYALPDGRVFEMVTPAENHEADVYVPLAEGRLNESQSSAFPSEQPFQVATDGDAVAYIGQPTAGGNGNVGPGSGNEFVARRAANGGWATQDISPVGHQGGQYQAFSGDLSIGVLTSFEEPVLAPGAPGGDYQDLYSHATGGEGYAALFTGIPPHRSVEEFGAVNAEGSVGPLFFAGASANFEHLLFEANDALTPEAGLAGPEANNLYDSVAGHLHVVNVLPNQSKSEPNASFGPPQPPRALGENPPDFSHVISEDGTRIYWTDLNTGELYMRENDTTTIPVSAGVARASFWTATPDGRYAFYTEAEELYRFADLGGPKSENLTTPNAKVQGVIGASDDGEYVYFVAQGALSTAKNAAGEVAVEGEDNLYVYEPDPADPGHHRTVFIAVLSGEDNEVGRPGNGLIGDWQPGPGHRTAEVTSGGRGLVFMSHRRLTGYVAEGEGPMSEVFVYDAAADRLFCASCDPSGAPPPYTATAWAANLPNSNSDTYLPHWISESAGGSRVFFDSLEPLSPLDTNGKQDAYEWEEEGVGSCPTGSTRGCVYLLSGGTSTDASYLLDASPNGDDVFVATRARLVPTDRNDDFNLFDARVGGVQAAAANECPVGSCQVPPPAAPTFTSPASVSLTGTGNLAITPVSTAPHRAKPLTRAQKLTKALGRCREKRNRRARGDCEALAKKRYGRKPRMKAKRSGRGGHTTRAPRGDR